ncbi:Helicase conserved C-terminal domain-containing protein [Nocardioides scoriae]|uniref:Helicase conserved C-terminal domain-containing protein n=1 Tax=Nocardioides scoriae TaxID=642780 RepID=A0A1H1SEA7_9ACTN|nr:helicase-associated domain-containing protein [Nocardioides scoriae]SDS46420.1 Helicase conserved C-terminal domain-containing protein [Nocardioides scoriae]
MSSSAPRSLADQLRGWPDERLARLLEARPDLATPAPHDSSQLAARVVVRTSVLRALDGLDFLELTVLQALVQDVDPTSLPASGEAADRALDRLLSLALAWGDPPRPVLAVSELLRLPDGPPVEEVPSLLEGLEPRARAILDHLAQTGADGRWGGGPGPTAALVSSGLLVRLDERHVTLPWTVRLCLWSHTLGPLDEAPVLATAERGTALVDRAAAGAAFEAVRRTELLLDRWGTHPPPALKAGGLGVRDLRATSTLLHVENDVTALVVETASAAGLLAQGMTDDLDGAWLPTDGYDVWNAGTPASRWRALARAWVDNPRLVSSIGGRVADKPVNALSPDLTRSWLRELRHDVLAELAALPAGHTLAAGTGVASLVERLRWRRPRRPASRLAQVPSVLSEAALLGVTGLDGLSGVGRRLLADPEDPRVVGELEELLPRPVDHVLIQADLTAVAPGPLEQEVARRLAMLADVESRGGATVYRFAATSVRRAFDAGWSSAEVHDFVTQTSRTPVPQSLTYLIDDVSRRFGTVRAGHAESFLRSDDETALTELVHAAGAESLRLRRIAPTVVVSDLPLATLLPRLRELGQSPVVESVDGTVQVARPDVFRARVPRRRSPVSVRTAVRTSAVVTAIRSGDRSTRPRAERGASATTPSEVIALLRDAAESGSELVIGYVGNDGTVAERVVTPSRVEGGQLTAYDERSDADRTFAVHRITAVSRQPSG